MPKKRAVRRHFPVKPPERRYGIKYRQWLEDQNSLLLLALKRSADAVIFMTVDGETTYANPIAEKLLGKTEAQLVGTNVLSYFRSADGEQVGEEFRHQVSIESELHCSLTFLRSHDGELIPIELHMSELRVQDVPVRIQATCRDLRRDLEFQRQLLTQAQTDQLTGCLNRWWFDKKYRELEEWARTSEDWLSLLFVDLDHFKRFNDESYILGDELIQLAADTIRTVLRPNDPLVRLGGDEFVLPMQGIDPEKTRLIAERILDSMTALDIRVPRKPQERFRLTASIGMSVLKGSDPRIGELLFFAQEAKRLAKEGGRNRVCVLPEQDGGDDIQPSFH